MRREDVLELLQQPALAQPGVGDQRQGVRRAAGQHGVEHRLEAGQFGLAADQRCLLALHAPRVQPEGAGLGPEHQPAGDGRVHALHGQRRLHPGIEQAAHQGPGVLADAQRAGRRRLLQPGGDVDGQAAQALVVLDAAAAHHSAGVDAHAGVEAVVAVHAQHVVAAPGSLGQQGQAAVHGALGVVFARAGRVMCAERGLHAVAGIAQHLAAVVRDDVGEGRQCAVDHRLHFFRIQPLDELRAADDIQEQHADLAQAARGLGRHRLCGGRGLRVEHCQALEQGSQRRVHQRIAECRAVRLQFSDGGFQGGAGIEGHRHRGSLGAACTGGACPGRRWERRPSASGLLLRPPIEGGCTLKPVVGKAHFWQIG